MLVTHFSFNGLKVAFAVIVLLAFTTFTEKTEAGFVYVDPCQQLNCSADEICVRPLPTGIAKCVSRNCTADSCSPGQACRPTEQGNRCVTLTCAETSCSAGQMCQDTFLGAECVEQNTSCVTHQCGNQRCVETASGPSCLPHTCDTLSCGPGTVCQPAGGSCNQFLCVDNFHASCVPVQSCSTTSCGFGETCRESANGPVCERPEPTCADLQCGYGSFCQETASGPGCVTQERNTCANHSCGSGLRCRDTFTGPVCITAPGSGRFGFNGYGFPKNDRGTNTRPQALGRICGHWTGTQCLTQ